MRLAGGIAERKIAEQEPRYGCVLDDVFGAVLVFDSCCDVDQSAVFAVDELRLDRQERERRLGVFDL